ncbi:four helix bundle protein [Vibrio gigantis]
MVSCRDYGFKDQITRSALSVPSNIAEGCERKSLKERKHFFALCSLLLIWPLKSRHRGLVD